jgi:hypothetical protein
MRIISPLRFFLKKGHGFSRTYPGTSRYPLAEKIHAIPLREVADGVAGLFKIFPFGNYMCNSFLKGIKYTR